MSLVPPGEGLGRDLILAVGAARVHVDPVTRLALASDASAYRLVPQAVVRPEDEAQVRALFGVARARTPGPAPSSASTRSRMAPATSAYDIRGSATLPAALTSVT